MHVRGSSIPLRVRLGILCCAREPYNSAQHEPDPWQDDEPDVAAGEVLVIEWWDRRRDCPYNDPAFTKETLVQLMNQPRVCSWGAYGGYEYAHWRPGAQDAEARQLVSPERGATQGGRGRRFAAGRDRGGTAAEGGGRRGPAPSRGRGRRLTGSTPRSGERATWGSGQR